MNALGPAVQDGDRQESDRQVGIALTVADRTPSARLAGFASAAISAALLAMVAFQFRNLDHAAILALVPASPWFWLTFAAY